MAGAQVGVSRHSVDGKPVLWIGHDPRVCPLKVHVLEAWSPVWPPGRRWSLMGSDREAACGRARCGSQGTLVSPRERAGVTEQAWPLLPSRTRASELCSGVRLPHAVAQGRPGPGAVPPLLSPPGLPVSSSPAAPCRNPWAEPGLPGQLRESCEHVSWRHQGFVPPNRQSAGCIASLRRRDRNGRRVSWPCGRP